MKIKLTPTSTKTYVMEYPDMYSKDEYIISDFWKFYYDDSKFLRNCELTLNSVGDELRNTKFDISTRKYFIP